MRVSVIGGGNWLAFQLYREGQCYWWWRLYRGVIGGGNWPSLSVIS